MVPAVALVTDSGKALGSFRGGTVMKSLRILAWLLLLAWTVPASGSAAVLSFGQSMYGVDGDAYEIFEGDCVLLGFEVYLSGLTESVSALEFSITVPSDVSLEVGGCPTVS